MTTTATDTAVFRIYINAPIDKVWAHIVDPAFNGTYAYGAPAYYDLVHRRGSTDGDVGARG